MIYILMGLGVIALLVWAGRRARPMLARGEVRIASGVLAALAIGAGGFLALRGGWLPGLLLALAGLGGAFAARLQPGGAPSSSGGMSLDQARSILGVGPEAGPKEIQAAYVRLMQRVHPDKGGADGLAAQLNAARDRLLGK